MEKSTTSQTSFLDRASVCLATGFYVSNIPAGLIDRFKYHAHGQALIQKKLTGAGLLGSIQGALTYLLLPPFLANAWWMILLALVFAVRVSARAEKALNTHDDPRIVIDEWIGTWVALWGMGQGRWLTVVLGVALFRLFDVFKGPIGNRLQKLPGGWGVAMDDVYAGFAANLGWRIGVLFVPGAFS